ncbi:MAG TPA: hypothetical protein VHS99_12225 [Chloroflexota bacterium]|nr:hypothetical protein [Chloroflexota bacterium]
MRRSLNLALVSTLHDPQARLDAALRARVGGLAAYAGVYLTVTDRTPRGVVERLQGAGAVVIGGKHDQIGVARRLALQAAVDGGHEAFFYCDFDRWLHWAGAYPEELAALPQRLAARRPRPWYVCLGRTARAFASHPYVQRVAEGATNRTLSLALGRRLDATAGSCWLSREGATLVLRASQEPTNATDLEWPALVYRAAPRRLAGLATEGLEFETAEFFAAEVAAAGGEAAWQRAHYERAEVWCARLGLAADSVRVATQVLKR